MKSVASIIGLVAALGIGYYVYQTSMTRTGVTMAPPQQQIDVVDIRSNLLVLGEAERQYLVAHGSYATLDELRADNLTTLGSEVRGYTFVEAINGNQGFTITAMPSDPDKASWPTLAISENMQVTERPASQ